MKIKGFCSRHQHDMANRLKYHGLLHLVKPDRAADIMVAWREGHLPREMICPLSIMMLELQAKANRLASQRGGPGAIVTSCPLCAIVSLTDDAASDVKQINGYADLMLGLCQTNGLVPGTSAKAIAIRRAQVIGEQLIGRLSA